MRRFFSLKAILAIVVTVLSVFVVVKVHRIDKHLSSLARGTKGFSPSNIMCEFPHNPAWEVAANDDQITLVNMMTQQPFRWLNKGYQACAFESGDGEYVIKFFNQQRLREKPFLEKPLEYLFNEKFRVKASLTQKHREEIFSSSKLAYEVFPEESGFVFVHLNRTEDLFRGIKLIDMKGQVHKVRPDATSFIIQKKATYVLPTLTVLMKEGNVEGAKKRLDQIFDLLLSLAKKGVTDSDYALIRNNNIGFTKDRAIYIDTGHITKNPNLDIRKQMDYEFKRRLKPLYEWIRFSYPDLAQYYDMRRHDILTHLTDHLADEETKTLATAAK